jgi:Ca-activated chloride channel family protein
MSFQDTQYAYPQARALLILLIPLLVLFWNYWNHRNSILKGFADPELWDSVLVNQPAFLFWGKALAICLAWICATIALMQPMSYGTYPEEVSKTIAGSKEVIGVKRHPHEVIFLVDVSASMGVKDMRSSQSRLDFAKDLIQDMTNRLDGQTAALETFTSEVNALSPLTTSYVFVYTMAKQIQINEGGIPGTNLLKALQTIRERYFSSPTKIKKTLVLITDGQDTEAEFANEPEKQKITNEIVNLVSDAEKNHLSIITVGMGSPQGSVVPNLTYENKSIVSALNEKLLQELSRRGKGKYYFANSYAAINLGQEIFKEIKRGETASQTISTLAEEQDNLVHRRYFQIPLGIAILLLLGIILIPDTLQKQQMGFHNESRKNFQ